jgi:hypothetical protein
MKNMRGLNMVMNEAEAFIWAMFAMIVGFVLGYISKEMTRRDEK